MDKNLCERLEGYIKKRFGGVIKILEMSPLSGGAIQENWAIDICCKGGDLSGNHKFVLRKDALSKIPLSHRKADEYKILKMAYASNVKVPKPVLFCDKIEIIGSPFFLMERLDGIAAGHILVKRAIDDSLIAELGQNLARIHAISTGHPALKFLQKCDQPPSLKAISIYRDQLDNLSEAYPAIEWGLSWLERNIPKKENYVFCHRDYRTGNLMINDLGLSGILDWEFAGFSAREEDLGWLCAKCWRFGVNNREVGGLGMRESLYAGYKSESGINIDCDHIIYWEIMAHVRWAIIALYQAQRVFDGDRSLELALTANIVPELEFEILKMIKKC